MESDWCLRPYLATADGQCIYLLAWVIISIVNAVVVVLLFHSRGAVQVLYVGFVCIV